MAGPSLNVSLTAQLQSMVVALLDTGRYQSASEVVRAGLRLLERYEGALRTSAVDDPADHFCPVCGRGDLTATANVPSKGRRQSRLGPPLGRRTPTHE
jgi:antitoxin ParD1/3/4